MGSARLGMDGGENVAPFIAGTTWSGRTLAYGCPHTPIGRFQTEARFVLEAQPDSFSRLCPT